MAYLKNGNLPVRLAIVASALLACEPLSACSNASKPQAPTTPTAATASPASVANSCAPPSPLLVGIKVDQYGTGYLDVRNYSYQGFDKDVATYISNQICNQDPTFVPVSSDSREPALESGAIRFFAATYTIDPGREAKFDLAGPYLVTYQGIMTGPHSPQISSAGDLAGKQVCVVGNDLNSGGSGSESAEVLKENAPKAIPVTVDSYSSCLDELRQGHVDAFSTDLAILYGYLTDPVNSQLRIVKGITLGNPIEYGIAFRKTDHYLCLKAAAAIKEMIATTQWDSYLGLDLQDYVKDQGDYPEPLKPTQAEINNNSCVTLGNN